MLTGINLIIFKLFIGGVIGAIIGLEREKNIQETHEQSPIGVRTNILIGILGSSSLYLSQIINEWVFIICFVAVCGLVFYPLTKRSLNGEKQMSYKTSISSLIVFLMGALAFSGEIQIALAVAVITTLVISLKATFQRIIYGISYGELIDATKFVLIAFIILPFLPNHPFDNSILQLIDPGLTSAINTDIINPYRIWLLIVIISGLNFLGYVLVKLFGKGKGYGLTGFIGGFYSSTITSLNLASVSKKQTDIVYPFVAGILLACGTSFLKMIVLIRTLSQPLFDKLFPGMIAMMIYLLASGVFFHFYGEKKIQDRTQEKLQKEPGINLTEIAVKPDKCFQTCRFCGSHNAGRKFNSSIRRHKLVLHIGGPYGFLCG